MGIFGRLGNLIRGCIDEGDSSLFRGETRRYPASSDPDVRAAYEELEAFLRNEAPHKGQAGGWKAGSGGNPHPVREREKIPEELRPDFAELEVPFGSSAAQCKAAYKELLKKHHPDRHGKRSEDTLKATEKSARINAAWDRIEKWREHRRSG
ncbi:MAG: J domain-containing protein [Treponema sp.]|jgi:DnaJ-domain-containing protein 1|nr:J domain-containing protein [Treponema sp.]